MGTIPTIATLASGAVVTSAYLNSLKAANDFWAATPRCYAYASAVATTFISGTPNVVTLDAEIYDIVQSGDTPMHDNATNNTRIVCRTAGKYEITGQVQIGSNATGVRTAQIRLNSAGNAGSGTLLAINQQGAVSGGATSVGIIPVEAVLSAGDYIEMFGTQTSGVNLTTVVGAGLTFMRMKLTGA